MDMQHDDIPAMDMIRNLPPGPKPGSQPRLRPDPLSVWRKLNDISLEEVARLRFAKDRLQAENDRLKAVLKLAADKCAAQEAQIAAQKAWIDRVVQCVAEQAP